MNFLLGQYALFPTIILICLHKLRLGHLDFLLFDLRQVVARNGLKLKHKHAISDLGILSFCSLVINWELFIFFLFSNLFEDILCFILYNSESAHILDMFFFHPE